MKVLIAGAVEASAAEKNAGRAGDALVAPADVVMDRAFSVDAPPEAVWPWLVQRPLFRFIRKAAVG